MNFILKVLKTIKNFFNWLRVVDLDSVTTTKNTEYYLLMVLSFVYGFVIPVVTVGIVNIFMLLALGQIVTWLYVLVRAYQVDSRSNHSMEDYLDTYMYNGAYQTA